MDWASLLKEAREYGDGLKDRPVEAGSLRVVATAPQSLVEQQQLTFEFTEPREVVFGISLLAGGHILQLTPWALRQMCQKLNIPEEYILRSPPEVQEYNLNFALRSSESKWVLRIRDSVVRGILSPQYTPFNHYRVLRAVRDGLAGTRVSLISKHLDDELLCLVIGLDDYLYPIGWTFDGEQDLHRPTLYVVNSEVGMRSVMVILGIWRYHCSNGLMGFTEYQVRRRHLAINPKKLQEAITAQIGDAIENAPAVLGQLEQAKETAFDDPEKIIRQIAHRARLSAPVLEAVLRAYKREPEANHFGVIQAFTAAAKELPPNARLEIELLAGRILIDPLKATG